MSDHIRAMAILEALAPGTTDMKSVVIDGAPQSKARARFTKRGGAYHPAENRAAEKRTAERLGHMTPSPMVGNLAMVCVFYRPNRQRVDADNMLKHVCDAANRVLWIDDSQVTAIAGVVELDAVYPRTVVAIGRHLSTLVRDGGTTLTCAVCGGPFVKKGGKAQTFCSRGCHSSDLRRRNTAATIHVWDPCTVCGAKTSKPGVLRCRACWLKRSTEGAVA